MRAVSRIAGLARHSQRTALAPRILLPSEVRAAAFSTGAARRKEEPNKNPELPAFSLEGLGISRNMKFVIFGILGVFGTMETWMYCKWIWRWWKGEGESETN